MKRFISVFLAAVFLLSAFSIPAFSQEKISSFDLYEGETGPDDSLSEYMQRLHCSASCMPSHSVFISAYQDGVKKLEVSGNFKDDDGDGVATFIRKTIVFNGMDKNTENSSYTYAFVDRNKEYTLIFECYAYDFNVDVNFTFNGSSDKVSVEPVDDMIKVTIGPTKLASKVCSCGCHIIWWQAKNIKDFFRGLWFTFVQIRIWDRKKDPAHQSCGCGDMHYYIG